MKGDRIQSTYILPPDSPLWHYFIKRKRESRTVARSTIRGLSIAR